MNCIIIEDQHHAQEILEKYIADIGTLNLEGTFTDALQAMEILNTREIDLIFLDIHLPKLSGLDFLKTLRKPAQVILTTAFQDYALESYELDVVDYLLKPFSFQRFVKAVSKASTRLTSTSERIQSGTKSLQQEIFVKSGYDHIKIVIDDIFYLKSDLDYTEFHLLRLKHLSSEPLKYWEEELKDLDFVRIHKSYLINTSKIQKVSGNRVYLSGTITLPIGRAYKEGFNSRLHLK